MRDEQGFSGQSNVVSFPLRGTFAAQAENAAPKIEDKPLHVLLNDFLEKDALYFLQDFNANTKIFLQGVNSSFSLQRQNGEAQEQDIVEKTELTVSPPFGLEVWEAMVIPYTEELKHRDPQRHARYVAQAQKAENPEIALSLIAGMGLIGENAGYKKMLSRLKEAFSAVCIHPHLVIEESPDGQVVRPHIIIGPAYGRPRDVREDIRAYLDKKNHLRPLPSL